MIFVFTWLVYICIHIYIHTISSLFICQWSLTFQIILQKTLSLIITLHFIKMTFNEFSAKHINSIIFYHCLILFDINQFPAPSWNFQEGKFSAGLQPGLYCLCPSFSPFAILEFSALFFSISFLPFTEASTQASLFSWYFSL